MSTVVEAIVRLFAEIILEGVFRGFFGGIGTLYLWVANAVQGERKSLSHLWNHDGGDTPYNNALVGFSFTFIAAFTTYLLYLYVNDG